MESLSSENQTLVQAAINSVNIQLSTSATAAERMNAGKYCEDLKKDRESLKLAFSLMHPSLEGPVRMYGLSVLEYHVKHGWSEEERGEGSGHGQFGNQMQNVPAVLTPKQKSSLQSSMINMLAMGTRELVEEDAYVKEKACVVMVEMAKRSWPQEWPSLLSELVEGGEEVASTKGSGFAGSGGFAHTATNSHPPVATIGPTQLELVISFFRILAEEIGSPLCELPNARRKMMIHSLTHLCATSLFPSWYQHLDYYYGVYKEAKQGFTDDQVLEMLPGGTLGPSSHTGGARAAMPTPELAQQASTLQTAVLIIYGILQALIAFAEWMKIELLLGQTDGVLPQGKKSKSTRPAGGMAAQQQAAIESKNMAEVVVLFLGEFPFRLKAAELLLVMVSRPRPDRDHMIFLFDHMEMIHSALASVPAALVRHEMEHSHFGAHSLPSLSFSRRISQTVCLLGQIYLDFLNVNKPPPNLDMFMSMMLDIAAHPSLQLSSLTPSFWKRMLSQDQFQSQPYFISTCETLLGNMAWSFVKWQFDTIGDQGGVCPADLHFFRSLDFEDDEETYIAFQAENRGNLSRSLISPIALLLPATSICFANFQWTQCVQIFIKAASTDTPTGRIDSDSLSALIAMFESAAHITATINDHLSPASMGFPLTQPAATREIANLYARGSHPPYGTSSSNKTTQQLNKYNRAKKGKKKHKGNKGGASSKGDHAPLLQASDVSSSLIFDTSGQLLLSMIRFESAVDEITAIQVDACKSFLSYFYCQPEALDALLTKLLSLVVYFGAFGGVQQEGQAHLLDFCDPTSFNAAENLAHLSDLQRAVASAQMAYEQGDQATCGALMGDIMNQLPFSVKLVRRKACTALISIAAKIPSAMVGKLSDILNTISVWTTRGLVSGSEIILLMDWVSSLSNAMDSSEQSNLLGGLISPQVVQWQDDFFSKATSSPLALLAFAGALPRHSKRQRKMLGAQQGLSPYDPSLYNDLPPELIPQNPEASQANRQSLGTLMRSLEAVWRRAANWKRGSEGGNGAGGVPNPSGFKSPQSPPAAHSNLDLYHLMESNPLSHFDLNLLPNLLRLIACLHQVWREDVKDRYDESCLGAYQLNAHLVSTWLRRHHGSGASGQGGAGEGAMDDYASSAMMSDMTGGNDYYASYAAEGDDHASAIASGLPSQSVWNSFFTQTRSAAYTILGFIISHQTPFWNDSTDLLDSFIGAVLTDIDSAHPFDISCLLKKVIIPAIKTCPPHAYEHLHRLVEPAFSRAIYFVSNNYLSKASKERAAAQAVAKAAANATNGPNTRRSFGGGGQIDDDSNTGQSTDEEIIMDRSVVELLTSVSLAVQACVLRSYGNRLENGEDFSDASCDASSSSTSLGKKDPLSYISPLSDFFLYMMKRGGGSSSWLLAFVNDIFAWDENVSTKRMCNVVSTIVEGMEEASEQRLFAVGPVSASTGNSSAQQRKGNRQGGSSSAMGGMTSAGSGMDAGNQEQLLLNALEQNPMLPWEDQTTVMFLANDTFKTVLLCLHRASENAGMLISLARDLYCLHPDSANKTLLEIPNITHNTIAKFNAEMGHQATEKGKSGALRDLLEKEAGWDLTPATSSATHATRILDVPAPLFALHIAKRQKAAKEKQSLDEQADSGLRTLFGSP